MANIIKRFHAQEEDGIENRIVVYYEDDVTLETKTVIENYADLTTGEKATYDAFKVLCESKMV